jgi:hypothetical protein
VFDVVWIVALVVAFFVVLMAARTFRSADGSRRPVDEGTSSQTGAPNRRRPSEAASTSGPVRRYDPAGVMITSDRRIMVHAMDLLEAQEFRKLEGLFDRYDRHPQFSPRNVVWRDKPFERMHATTLQCMALVAHLSIARDTPSEILGPEGGQHWRGAHQLADLLAEPLNFYFDLGLARNSRDGAEALRAQHDNYKTMLIFARSWFQVHAGVLDDTPVGRALDLADLERRVIRRIAEMT